MPEHLTLEFVTRDKEGIEIGRMRHECHSFLTQYYQLLYVLESADYAGGAFTLSVTDTGGTGRTYILASINASSVVLATRAAGANALYGIQVGTGNAANTGATYALSAQIAHGIGAGQLSYGSMGITQPSGTTPLSYTFTRTFTNNSGGTINITEADLVISGQDTGTNQRYWAILRDVFAAVQVLNGANTTATYTKSYTIA